MPGLIVAEIAMWLVPFFTFGVGLLVGYLAQKSGFCSVGGFRDLIMFKQTRLFIGYMTLIGSSLLFYALFWLMFPQAFPTFFAKSPQPGAPGGLALGAYIILAIIGGFGLGLLGVLLGGCPLRQMVMGAEGNLRSVFFIIGMCIGAVVFHLYISGWVVQAFTTAGLGA